MPLPDRMLATLRRATELVRSTPGRYGHLTELQNCAEVLVVGDLHGHIGNFQAMWKLADLGTFPRRHLVVQELVHGKFFYPTGGDKSHQLVDLFAAVKCQFPDRVHYLPGNHEMAQMTDRPILKGDADLNVEFTTGVRAAYGPMADEILAAYFDLWRACPLLLRTPNRVVLSHTFVPGKHLDRFDPARLELDEYPAADYEPGGLVYGMTWGRDTTAATAAAFLRLVRGELLVTGHIPADDGFTVANDYQVTLDCSGSPGGYCLVPADRRLTVNDLVKGIGVV